MRRAIENKKIIIYILLVAFFTVSSYVFDQTAVRIEDSIRNKNILIDTTKTNLKNFESLSSQLETIRSDLDNLVSLNLKDLHFWLKSYLLITRYDLDSNENRKFFKDSEDALYQIKDRLLSTYQSITVQSGDIGEKLDEVYSWNYELFSKYMTEVNGEKLYEGVYSNFYNHEEIFNNNLSKFKIKNFKKYDVDILYPQEKRNKVMQSFYLNNWYDLHQFTLLLIKNLDDNGNDISENELYIDELAEKKEILLYSEIEKLKNISNKKNSSILLSIFSQILSLLFLLMLFRNLILNSTAKIK
tara:strand:- start:180 stop:1079 length:900 start_codon:yes stop_codon:yes gene_type:complete